VAHDREIVIDIVPVLEEDIPELSQVMTRAFDDDARKHLGVEKGGPPDTTTASSSASGSSPTMPAWATR